MTNVALVVGISDYVELKSLPACEYDAKRMRDLLRATKKFDDILCITEGTNVDTLKESIRAFFEKHQQAKDIDEAFIFVSGHGTYNDDAMFCCSDFDSKRPKSTSITSSELDDLLRSVGSNVAVKVVDACHSGSTYIKDSEESFEKALEPKSGAFKSFICMASSRQDQNSYAVAHESKFTAKWIEAALQQDTGAVLYRDIKASLADAFSGDPKQTPHFVDQGSGLEKFAIVTEEMRQLRAAGAPLNLPTEAKLSEQDQLLAAVKSLRENPVAKAAAMDAIDRSGKELVQQKPTDEVVETLYEMSCNFDGRLDSLPKGRALSEFAQKGEWSRKYFVEIVTEPFSERVPRDTNWASLISITGSRILGEEELVTKTVRRPAKIRSTEQLPFETAVVTLAPREGIGLKAFNLYLGIVQSKTEVIVLSATCSLSDKGWDRREPDLSTLNWQTERLAWQEIVKLPRSIWDGALRRCLQEIRSYLEGLAPRPLDPADQVA